MGRMIRPFLIGKFLINQLRKFGYSINIKLINKKMALQESHFILIKRNISINVRFGE